MQGHSYVLITPAHNEETFIEATIRSVVSQTALPAVWVIVDDRSTDRTGEIVRRYAKQYRFIRYVRIEEGDQLKFGAKVRAFARGYESVKDIGHAFIGNLDADVSFGKTYFEQLMAHFAEHERLGIAGGIIQERIKGKYVCQQISANSVAGAVQLFRKECYEDIGGYIPMEHGGIDAAAEILARSKGWEVRTFPQYRIMHHRRVTTGKKNVVATKFYQGVTSYLLGYSPVFHIIRSLFRITQNPIVVGSAASIAGYCYAYIQRKERKLPYSAIRYLRREQMGRLKESLFNGVKA